MLAVVAGALGRYLRARGHSTLDLELRAMVPISVRADEEHGALGNRVSAMMAPLPVGVEDPVHRLDTLTRTMGDLKGSRQAVGASLLTELTASRRRRSPLRRRGCSRDSASSTWWSPTSPGRNSRCTCWGASCSVVYPMVPLAKNQAVCVGIMSYNGQVNFGLIGDFDGLPELDGLADDLRASLDELAAVAEASPGETPSPSPTSPSPAGAMQDGAGAGTQG